VPAANDYKVALALRAFYINVEGDRMAVLEHTPVGFRYRLLDGPQLTDDLKARVRARIREFNFAWRASAQ
jgi:hypothetical protein